MDDISMTKVSPNLIARENVWDAELFCGGFASVLASQATVSVAELGGLVVEGLRDADEKGDAMDEEGHLTSPSYGQMNIGQIEFSLETTHCSPPSVTNPCCVQPGDVVVTKISPIRASWVTPGAFRHPIDSNCYLVRGLTYSDGFWLALCINQPACGHYLVRKSGAAVLPRVRKTALRSLAIPKPPDTVRFLSEDIADCIDQRIASLTELFRLVGEVNATVERAVPDPAISAGRIGRSGAWHRHFSPKDIDYSLTPTHVALTALQRLLHEAGGWLRLGEVLGERQPARDRLAAVPAGLPYLRLSDLTDDFTIPEVVPSSESERHRRVYAERIMPDMVLVSTLVTNPRVAFAGDEPTTNLHAADHWEQLRFRDTPGAWALVLNSPPIRDQLLRMAMGTFQQFANSAMIHSLLVPDIPTMVRQKWDNALRRHVKLRTQLNGRWLKLQQRANDVLWKTHAEYGKWTSSTAVVVTS